MLYSMYVFVYLGPIHLYDTHVKLSSAHKTCGRCTRVLLGTTLNIPDKTFVLNQCSYLNTTLLFSQQFWQ